MSDRARVVSCGSTGESARRAGWGRMKGGRWVPVNVVSAKGGGMGGADFHGGDGVNGKERRMVDGSPHRRRGEKGGGGGRREKAEHVGGESGMDGMLQSRVAVRRWDGVGGKPKDDGGGSGCREGGATASRRKGRKRGEEGAWQMGGVAGGRRHAGRAELLSWDGGALCHGRAEKRPAERAIDGFPGAAGEKERQEHRSQGVLRAGPGTSRGRVRGGVASAGTHC